MSVAAPGVGRGLAGAREWVRVVGAGSSHTSMCASAGDVGEGAGAVVGLCVNGRPVVVSRSASTNAAGRDPGNAAGGVYGSDCG